MFYISAVKFLSMFPFFWFEVGNSHNFHLLLNAASEVQGWRKKKNQKSTYALTSTCQLHFQPDKEWTTLCEEYWGGVVWGEEWGVYHDPGLTGNRSSWIRSSHWFFMTLNSLSVSLNCYLHVKMFTQIKKEKRSLKYRLLKFGQLQK